MQSKTLKYHLPHGHTAKLFSLLEKCVNENEELGIIIKQEIKLLISQIQEVQFSNDDMASHFPVDIEVCTKIKHYTHEFSWSRGDLSILILLYKADEVFGENYYNFMADTVGKVVSTRRKLLPINQNPFIRNGTAGIAHCFSTLYNLSNKSFYKEAYDYWISETYRYKTLGFLESNHNDFLDNYEGVNLILKNYEKGEKGDCSFYSSTPKNTTTVIFCL